MTKLLEKDTVFDFNEECMKAFKTLKEKLTNAPIMVSSDWSQQFEIMCDASDFAIGVVLGQREGKLQKFDIKIKNKKGAENTAAYHLSRLVNPSLEKLRDEDIDDNFPDETLMNISSSDEEEIP
ncbi:reverse transcriptase domain-containing protein [Tanacetum coccineum]